MFKIGKDGGSLVERSVAVYVGGPDAALCKSLREAFTLVNGRVTLSEVEIADSSRLRFALWGKNLTDEEYRVFGITAFEALGFAGAVFNEPRSFGLDIVFDYE